MNISNAFAVLAMVFVAFAILGAKTREDERNHLVYAIAFALLAIATAL